MSTDGGGNPRTAAISCKDLLEVFETIAMCPAYGVEATPDREAGKIHYYFPDGDNPEPLPDDIDDLDKYLRLPDRYNLNRGTRLVFDFAAHCWPEEAESIREIFRSRGAYSRFKGFLEDRGLLNEWNHFEEQAVIRACRNWCREHAIDSTE